MAFLLRVELPDVPGSLGMLASALGAAGADIEALEIVEHRPDGTALDDVLCELPPQIMPDALVTACHELEGVKVHWISRYNAGASLSLDLEAIERFTEDPDVALARLVEVLPDTFRVDWAMIVHHRDGRLEVREESPSAPELVPACEEWLGVGAPTLLPDVPDWDSTVLAGAPGKDRSGRPFVLVVGRHGGPAILPSELARLNHMVSLAASVQTA